MRIVVRGNSVSDSEKVRPSLYIRTTVTSADEAGFITGGRATAGPSVQGTFPQDDVPFEV